MENTSPVPAFDLSRWLRPVSTEAVFRDPGFCVWCGSMVSGPDGRFYLFYSRWPRKLGHLGWVSHSEVAYAVAHAPTGPYRPAGVALPARDPLLWDGMCTHNPTVLFAEGKYYLYYMGNTGDGAPPAGGLNFLHRNNQRVGVAVADDPRGPWLRSERPLIDISTDPAAPDALCLANPSVCRRPDGQYLMIYKAVGATRPPPFGGPVVHLAAISQSPAGPFAKSLTPIFTHPRETFAAEDPFVWCDGERYHAIVKDMHGHFTQRGTSLALFESQDGLNWQLAPKPLVSTLKMACADGRSLRLGKLERPQLWFDRGRPAVLFCAAAEEGQLDDSFNVAIPLAPP